MFVCCSVSFDRSLFSTIIFLRRVKGKMNKSKGLTAEKAASIGVFVLLAIFPIILTKKYFNITATRYLVFTLTSVVFFTVCGLLKINSLDVPPKIGKSSFTAFSAADISFALFFLVSIFSSVSSPYGIAHTFSGDGGRRMGLLMTAAMFFAYIFISRFYRLREYEFIFFGAVGAFASVFGLLQFIGLDPLGLLEGLSELDSVRFISFMGNINIYSSYLCIVLPLAMYMFCFSKKKSNMIFWLFVTSTAFIGLMTSISDSGYLGLAVALVFLAVLTAKEKKTFQRFFAVLITLFISAGIFDIVWKIFGNPEHPNSVPNEIISNPWVIATGSVVSAIFIIVLNSFDFSEKFCRGVRKFIIIAAVATVALCIGLIIWFTYFDATADIGKLSNYLRLSPNWGNGRGYAWTKLFEIFKERPLYQKLIGTGPETFGYEMVSRYNSEMYELFDFHFDNAHNDVLQYLITVGLLGVLAYVMLVVFSAKKCIKSENTLSRAMLLPIVAFFAQSLVNITQPITTPLFFVFLAFSQCKPCEEQTV